MYETLEQCGEWAERFRRRFPPFLSQMSGWNGTPLSMALDGFGASIMLAPRLRGERTHPLPPGIPTPAYLVAPYEGCPSDWRRTPDAFFVPIPLGPDGKGPGMWYDWRGNDHHTHDIAVVPSTTGLNPITGRKTDALRLEQYRERCPIHNIPFEGERFCKECNYRHPPQGYVSAPNTLWWDGFRRADGTVEQFWLSDDVLRRDVGVAVLGADRVPAFGFAFFRAVNPKPQPWRAPRGGPESHGLSGGWGNAYKRGGAVHAFAASPMMGIEVTPLHAPASPIAAAAFARRAPFAPEPTDEGFEAGAASCAFVDDAGASVDYTATCDSLAEPTEPPPALSDDREVAAPPPIGASLGEIRAEAIRRAVAVGRGARIEQTLASDHRALSEWQLRPAAVITVYFVPEQVAIAILNGPKRDIVGEAAGYLAHVGVPAGAD